MIQYLCFIKNDTKKHYFLTFYLMKTVYEETIKSYSCRVKKSDSWNYETTIFYNNWKNVSQTYKPKAFKTLAKAKEY